MMAILALSRCSPPRLWLAAFFTLLLMTSHAHGGLPWRWCEVLGTYSGPTYSNPEDPSTPLVVFGINRVNQSTWRQSLVVLDSDTGAVISNISSTTTTAPDVLLQQVAVGVGLVYTSGTLPLPSLMAWPPGKPFKPVWLQPAVPAEFVTQLLYVAQRGSVFALTSKRLFELDALTGAILRSWSSDSFLMPSNITSVAVTDVAVFVQVHYKGTEWLFAVRPEVTNGYSVGSDHSLSFAVRGSRLAYVSRDREAMQLIDVVTDQSWTSRWSKGTAFVASTKSSVLFDSEEGWRGFNWADGSVVSLDADILNTPTFEHPPLQWNGTFFVMLGKDPKRFMTPHAYAVSEANKFQGQRTLNVGSAITVRVIAANSANNEVYLSLRGGNICKYQVMG